MTERSQNSHHNGDAPKGGRRGERYAELPDDRGGYSYEDNRRGPMILFMAVVVLLVFAVVVWNAYKRGVREGDAAGLPQIAAEGPFKSRPADPGGAGDVDTDKLVFDQVDGSARDQQILPRQVREEPVPIEASAGGGLSSKQPSGRSIEPSKPLGGSVGTPGAPLDLRPGAEAIEPAPVARAETLETPRSSVTSAPAPKPAPTPTASRSTQAANPIFEGDGRFVVQLSSLSSSAAADAEWARVTKAHGDLFAGALKLVQTADLGERGVYHRLRAGAFATRDDATAFCDAYKQRGGDCLVRTR